jgi:vitamin B12 transporter
MHQTVRGLALGAAFIVSAHAEDLPTFVGETIVVTPTRIAQSLASPLQHTSVITRGDIEASTARDLPGLLRMESGVEIAQTGGLGAQTAIRIRGSEADQVLVLVDGVRVSSATTGMTAIDQILLDEIERIEIVRGNVSSVYGSEAIGGVVQIFTRRGQGTVRGAASVGGGADDYRKLAFSLGGEAGDTRVHLGAAHVRTDGFSSVRGEFIPAPGVFVPADIDDDGYRNTTVNFALSRRFGADHEVGVSAFQTRGDTEFDGAWQNHSEQTLKTLSAYAENRWHPDWFSRVRISQGSDDLQADLDGAPVDRFKTRNQELAWSNQLTRGPGTFTLGLEYLRQQLDSTQSYSRETRRVSSLAGGYTAAVGAHDVQFNARYDDYDDVGGAASGLIGYGFRLTPSLRLSAALSNAFRAPSFNELYGPFGSNPGLDPERASSAEIGLTHSSAWGLARATAFVTRTRDLISFIPPTWAASNVDRARNEGVELGWNGRLAGLDMSGALTLQDPKDETTGLGLLRRADVFGSASIGSRVGEIDWRVELLASGPRPDVHATDFYRVSVPGYGVVNAYLGWEPTSDWRLSGRLVNVFDKDYSLVHGYNTQGRAMFIELAYQPK